MLKKKPNKLEKILCFYSQVKYSKENYCSACDGYGNISATKNWKKGKCLDYPNIAKTYAPYKGKKESTIRNSSKI